ncbi:type II toxin-antitoxin system HigB family toxin [Paraburkholderia terrae]
MLSWHEEAIEVEWTTPQDIKARYLTASFVGKNHVVFEIKGNDCRLNVASLRIDITVFYTCVNSLLEDIDAMDGGNIDALTQPELLAFHEGFQDRLLKTLRPGDELIGLVSEMYPPSTLWINLPG